MRRTGSCVARRFVRLFLVQKKGKLVEEGDTLEWKSRQYPPNDNEISLHSLQNIDTTFP